MKDGIDTEYLIELIRLGINNNIVEIAHDLWRPNWKIYQTKEFE